MPAPAQQNDTTIDALLVTAVLVAVLIGLWLLWRESIIFLGYVVSLALVAPFAVLDSVFTGMGLSLPILFGSGEAWKLLTTEPWSPDTGKFLQVMTIGGRCLTLLLLPALLVGFAGSRTLRPDMVFRRRHDLESCINELGKHWSCARWLSSVNPASEPETAVPSDQVTGTQSDYGDWQEAFNQFRATSHDSGENRQGQPLSGSWLMPSIREIYQPPPFGRALRPEEWIVAHGIDAGKGETDLLLEVEMLLIRQLRARWRGWQALKPHHKSLLAALILIRRGGGERAESLIDDLMNMMADSGGRENFATLYERKPVRVRIEEILVANSGRVEELARGHYWVETVLAEAWEVCREGQGVWPSARFQWLKVVDRTLWYTISSMGSDAVYVEAAGILAHHRAERQLQMPLAVPRTRRASEAIVYDYLDLAPERNRMRQARQNANSRIVPGVVARG